jgi:hypothetical protein
MSDKKKNAYLRELAALAHKRELSTALQTLQAEFERWQLGQIDCFELNRLVHEFHHGKSRKLYSNYDTANIDIVVPAAIFRGIITEEELVEPYKTDLLASVERFR